MTGDDIERFCEAAWAAIEADDFDAAAREAERMLAESPDLPEALYTLGVVALADDRPHDAVDQFVAAHESATDWPDPLTGLAWASFRSCDFARAEKSVRESLSLDQEQPDAHHLAGLLAERRGEEARARKSFDAARGQDPGRYPSWPRLSESVFQSRIEQALLRLPGRFRDALDNLAIVLDTFPETEVLTAAVPPHDPEILGLYVGVPLTERQDASTPTEMPGMIHLFQRNLERLAPTREELEHEIAVTLYHEIAHAFGFEEEDMSELGLE